MRPTRMEKRLSYQGSHFGKCQESKEIMSIVSRRKSKGLDAQ